MSQRNKEEIERELAKRELARRNLWYYLQYVFPWFQNIAYQWDENNLIHDQIIEALMASWNGEAKRLMINCPPRLGKSMIASQYFPSRWLGKDPTLNFIQASYGAELSNSFGRKTKQITMEQSYKNVFPDFELSQEKREWGNRETKQRWGYYSVGVGGALTGKGWDYLIIDDPVKDRMEADSPTIQQRNIDWYDSVASTRLQTQDSRIICIMTRWSVDDLGGYILREEKDWTQVTIKAIDERGKGIIRPWKRDVGHMEDVKHKMIPKNWEALYQQNPIASTDSIFKREYFDYFLLSDFEKIDSGLDKKDLKVWLIIDPAFSSSVSSDDAVILAVGEHIRSREKYLIDGYANTSAPSRTLDAMVVMYNNLVANWFDVNFLSVEWVSINKDQVKFVDDVRKKLTEFWINIPVTIYSPRISKNIRIKDNLEAPMSQKALKIHRNISDNTFIPRLESQFLQYPNGKHDDIIDTVSQAFEVFHKKRNVSIEKREPKARTIIDPRTGKQITTYV